LELLAFLSSENDEFISQVTELLKNYTVYPLKTLDELEDLYNSIPLNLILIDTSAHRLSSLERLLNKLDNDIVVLITPEKMDSFTKNNLPQSVYDCVSAESMIAELSVVVEGALEKQRVKHELSLLKNVHSDFVSKKTTPPYTDSEAGLMYDPYSSFLAGKYMQNKVFIKFARMLTASFDIQKLFDHFIDSVMEITRVNRMSVMLRDKEDFYVKTQYGLDPFIAENMRLRKDSALASYLSRTGRIMQKPVNPGDTSSIRIKKEMELLQCSFSFPMIHNGKLIGIINIGNKITEDAFYREELEIIYVLCNYLAMAVKDIEIYHQMWYQQEFTKNIISCMNSGIIAIDKEEKITIFNKKASEILGIDNSDIIGRDLRRLPSPLGDILYETMVTGRSYNRHETEISSEKLPVGINSFRLLDENKKPIGAGIVFSDLSDSRKLEEQRRRAEKLEAVNDLMSKIAHEIRNPLTSIHTYAELLSDRLEEDELNSFYSSSVKQSIQSIDGLIDKLVAFSSTMNYNFQREDVNSILSEASDFIVKKIPQLNKFNFQEFQRPFYINADRKLLIKAIFYLVQSIVERTSEPVSISLGHEIVYQGLPYILISLKYKGKTITEEERHNLLKPLLNINNLGTGLNIHICKKILENHKGSLDISSENDSNVFIIKIPALERRGSANLSESEHIGRQ
jgi:PAS domain S-box-containing protein